MRTARAEDPAKFRRFIPPAQQHRYWLKCRYGITVNQWNELFVAQDGRCYLCGDPMTVQTAHLDHDHSCCSGMKACGACLRGLACQLCNQGIGQFGDDPERMRVVATNLEQANQKLRERRLAEQLGANA
jgi:hypothetical protein